MKYELSKLRGRIVEKYGTIAKFSKAYGISAIMMSKKLNGKSAFTQKNVLRICELLDISRDEIGEYFFGLKV